MSSAQEFGPKYAAATSPQRPADADDSDAEEGDMMEVRMAAADEADLAEAEAEAAGGLSPLDSLAANKRKASPFTSTMDVALATAFTTEKNILDGTFREEGVPTRQQKLSAWKRIRDCVNAFSGDNNMKTVQQCKDRHRNLIQAVRFKRASGFLEGPLPLPAHNQSQETNEQTSNSTNSQPTRGDGMSSVYGDSTPTIAVSISQQNGSGIITSTPIPLLTPKERRPLKRPAASSSTSSSSSADTLEDYRKRKLAILVKEHIVRVELMKAQTEYYRTKTDLLIKHSCSRPPPASQPPKLPSHSQPIFPGNS